MRDWREIAIGMRSATLTYQKLDDGVEERSAVLVDQCVKLNADANLERKGRNADAKIEANDVFEGYTQELAVAEDGVGVDVGADVEERFLAGEMVELARGDNVCTTDGEINVACGGGFGRARVGVAAWARERRPCGCEEGEKECGDAHVACCRSDRRGRGGWREEERRMEMRRGRAGSFIRATLRLGV